MTCWMEEAVQGKHGSSGTDLRASWQARVEELVAAHQFSATSLKEFQEKCAPLMGVSEWEFDAIHFCHLAVENVVLRYVVLDALLNKLEQTEARLLEVHRAANDLSAVAEKESDPLTKAALSIISSTFLTLITGVPHVPETALTGSEYQC